MSTPPSKTLRVNGVSRRRLLGFIGVGLVSSLMMPVSLKAFAADGQPSPVNLDKFMRVSRALTGKRYLNPVIGQRLLAAILQYRPEAVAQLALLQTLPTGTPTGWSAPQQDIARLILQGWYLGQVGEGENIAVVTYEKALMFDAVSDVLVIRSYCTHRPGYWAAKPDVTF
ncbi:sugar dehydrogenase complex small subunit [Serratia quinivorans]|uniref:sugar dehydrogenase complex small subunit n=1 Tax=Serratia quinivorans TaxID=137545 RepID=UPI003F956705